MRPPGLVRRLGLFLLGLAPLLAAGCLAGYVYPKVSFIPRLDVAAPADEVWAFKVQNEREAVLSLPPNDQITLRPLPHTNTVGAQADLRLERGYWMWGGLRLSEHVSHRLTLRLYRRGYRTVEVNSWKLFEGVHWTRTESLADREQAIDQLVAPPDTTNWWLDGGEGGVSFDHLAAGSTEPGHRQALLFAAAEHELLAQSPGIHGVMRDRLADKARKLRERAEK
jgi:hypothetical protein